MIKFYIFFLLTIFIFLQVKSQQSSNQAYQRQDISDDQKNYIGNQKKYNPKQSIKEIFQRKGILDILQTIQQYDKISQTNLTKERKLNRKKKQENLPTDYFTIIMGTIIALIMFVGILLCIRFLGKTREQDQFNVLKKRIMARQAQADKNYEALKYVHQHGVHKNRARGDIYRINL